MDKQPSPNLTKNWFGYGKKMKYAMITLGALLGAEALFLNSDFAHCKKHQLSCIQKINNEEFN